MFCIVGFWIIDSVVPFCFQHVSHSTVVVQILMWNGVRTLCRLRESIGDEIRKRKRKSDKIEDVPTVTRKDAWQPRRLMRCLWGTSNNMVVLVMIHSLLWWILKIRSIYCARKTIPKRKLLIISENRCTVNLIFLISVIWTPS